MKAWLLDGLDGIERMRLGEAPEPIASVGEAVLAVELAALNPADRYLAEGRYPSRPALPHIAGRDGVGTVVSVGEGATDVRVGDRRVVLRGETGVTRAGTFAQRVTVKTGDLVEIPPGWTDEQAAGATLVYLTAYQALSQWNDLPARAVVLVTGASGGVGVAATQLARAMGHTVIAQSRNEEKARRLRALGADLTVDPNDARWPMRIAEFLGERRVDLAIDSIGGALLNEVIGTLGMHGRISCVGALAGPVPSFNTARLFFRRIQVRGVAVGSYSNQHARQAWRDVVTLLQRDNARPQVDAVFAFEQLIEAFERLKQGPMGKVLVQVGP